MTQSETSKTSTQTVVPSERISALYEFLDASMDVWREVDGLEEQGPYPGIASSSYLRIREREAWEAVKQSGATSRDLLALAGWEAP